MKHLSRDRPAAVTVVLLGLAIAGMSLARPGAEGWTPLFNGNDLAGWDTWLGRPHASVAGLDLKRNEKGDYAETVGLNKDPRKVYTVVREDGAPALRISGEIFGALTTRDEFENYHLRLEFKWGQKRWPPREKAVRDSGVLYHCVGPHGAAGTFWMQSQECQVQEHDCGDYWSVAGAIVDVEAERKDGKGPLIHKKGGTKFSVPTKETGPRIVKAADYEKPTGQWNTIEVICLGDVCIHAVNGKVNMVMTNSRRRVGDKEEPLTRGKIQIQSEGAEVFYRNIAIRRITEIPADLRP